MKYCIVMPRFTENYEQSYQFPIGIAYVSASLKNSGRDVLSYNLNYKQGTVKELIKKVVIENDIDVLATGGITGQYWFIKEILDAAREIKPNIILWVGGGIITSSPIPAMEALEVADYGMIGEGEITICELAEAVEGKREISTVDGVIYKQNEEWVITNPRAEITDLDSVPFPDYEGFDFEELLSKKSTKWFGYGSDNFCSMSLGRSCPFNCTFCFHPSGTKYRRRSLENFFLEVDYLIEKYKINSIFISDELFLPKFEEAKQFCAETVKRGISFGVYHRVDMVNREILELLRDSGCKQILFGLESADNRILKSMRKHITIEQIEKALQLCKEVGIEAAGSFIYGDEEETVDSARNTINWWKAHPEYNITNGLIIMYPGSVLYQNALKKGIIKDEVEFIKAGCPYTNTSKLTEQEYKDLALEISMLVHERKVSEVGSVKYMGSGTADYTAKCENCGSMNTFKSWKLFDTWRSPICEKCGQYVHINLSDKDKEIANNNFKLLKDRNIAIWPMISVVEEMRRIVPGIMESNVYFVDSSLVKQGARHYGKIVDSPSIIDEKQVDTVFLTARGIAEVAIIDELKKYSSVKHIFFAEDLLDPDFVNRI